MYISKYLFQVLAVSMSFAACTKKVCNAMVIYLSKQYHNNYHQLIILTAPHR
jgi:hypothetical protein